MSGKAVAIPPPFYSPYLDDQCNKINSKPVPWEGYQRAKLVSNDEVQLLKSINKLRSSTFSTQGAQYAKLYIDLLRKLQRVDTVQAVLVAINDMISSDPGTTIPLFHDLSSSEHPDDPYGAVVKCLGMDEEFPVLGALRILALLIATDPNPFPPPLISPLLTSLSTLLNSSRQPPWEVAAQTLSAILGRQQFRSAVWQEGGCLSGLVKALKTNPNPQCQYWSLSCFWMISFEEEAARGLDKQYDIVAVLIGVARAAVKEKVTRMVVATLRNLLTLAPTQNLPSFFVQSTLPFITSLQARKWSDEEITEDLDYLADELKSRLEGLTTYDEYTSELQSGKLVWSPVHESEDFWKENGTRLGQEDGGKAVKLLVELLKTSSDPTVLAVSAHDIGQYIKHGGERAKKTVTDQGGKTRMIELMANDNADVRYRALMSVQRLMSQHV